MYKFYHKTNLSSFFAPFVLLHAPSVRHSQETFEIVKHRFKAYEIAFKFPRQSESPPRDVSTV